MTVSLRRLLLAAIVVGAAIGVAALVYFVVPTLLGPHGGGDQAKAVDATVSATAACNAGDPYDTVTFTVNGVQRHARLNGCGNATGQHVLVAPPDQQSSNQLVQPAATAEGAAPPGYRRLGFGLLALAGIAGTGYGYLVLRGGPPRRPGQTTGSGALDLPAPA
ncbi:MAG: hypothetical protein ACRDRN_02275 [Sciscionella sp.]